MMIKTLKQTLAKTRDNFKGKFDELISSNKNREEILAELEESLIMADVGLSTTDKLIASIRARSKKTDDFPRIKALLEDELLSILSRYPPNMRLDEGPSVVMFVGVNGGGKTTSIAKAAFHYMRQSKAVMFAAADTFRAAAQEQLSVWGKKLNIPVISGQYDADPASVVYDALHSFKAKKYDLLFIDTAGRIHTNVNLMNELEKIKRVITREISGAPQEVLLVLDASIGQNALIQAREFLKFSGLTGIFLTKLDGTAKGGCVLGIIEELQLPIKFIGVGEREEDCLRFSGSDFVKALVS